MASEDEVTPGTRVADEDATYLGRDWEELAALVEEDGNFDFSRISIHEVRALFEHGRWWEKWGRPGVERLRQLIEGEAVDYFTFNDDGWMRICYLRAHKHMTLLDMALRDHEKFGDGMRRLPPGIATLKSVKTLYDELRSEVNRHVRSKLSSSCEARCYKLRGWPGSYLVSHHNNTHMDEQVLHEVGVGLGDQHMQGSALNHKWINVGAQRLLVLCKCYPQYSRNPILLLPSLREAQDWGECMDDRGAAVSSFLVASPELLEYLNRTRVPPR